MSQLFSAHLHNHTDMSKMDATTKVKKMVERAKELGYSAIAITDHGTTSNWVDFELACDEHNVKPIFGVEGYEMRESSVLKVNNPFKVKYYHSLFLGKNKKGTDFINKLVTFSNKLENIYYKPRYSVDFLMEHKDEIKGNVIWSSACIGGRIPKLLLEGKIEEADNYYKTMVDIFGKDNVYIEVQNHGVAAVDEARKLLIEFAKKHDANLLATNDVHYLHKNEYIAREILIARDGGKTLRDRKEQNKIYPSEMYLKSKEEMDLLFSDIPSALENTKKIADEVEWVSFKGAYWHYPKIDIPEGYNSDTYLRKITFDAFEEKYPINVVEEELRKELIERLDLELSVMSQMDASDYMLIDADFTSAARKMMPVGPGRGSACGSKVAELIGITQIDPLKYDLFFERFMNPKRVSMPDIDSDFSDKLRYLIINYVVEKYGKDKVAQILTLGTIGPRLAIRDTGAVLEIDPKTIDKVAKLIPQEPKITIDKALNAPGSELMLLYQSDPEVKELIDTAKTIEGVIRQTGTHAAGIIISDVPLVEIGALMEQEGTDIPVFMFNMAAVEYLKLIKFDFLGLKTLTVMDDTVKLVKKNKGIDIDLDDPAILMDKEVYKFIATGKTDGAFQLESPGMQSFMQDLNPQSIEDIIIGISMYRPGPFEKIPTLIANKKDLSKITYYETAKMFLKPILDVTYGVTVYQEQAMQIVRDLAGYDFGRSDILRRAMSKKKDSVMAYERNIFVYGAATCPHCKGKGKEHNGDKCKMCDGKGEIAAKDTEENIIIPGCIRNGITEEDANAIYDELIDFAAYGFNKSHAAAYGTISVKTAYLLLYHPVEYWTAYLNSLLGGDRKTLKKYMAIVKKHGFNIIRPDINQCSTEFTCRGNDIYMGLTALKNVSAGITEAIKVRERDGEFKDLQDLLTKVSLKSNEVESLIMTGAFDSFNLATRSQMLTNLDDILKLSKKDREKAALGQFSLFDLSEEMKEVSKLVFPKMEEFSKMRLFAMEKEKSGFYLSGHPLDLPEYKSIADKSNITTVDEFTERDNKKEVTLVGIVNIDGKNEGIRISRKGTKYASFRVEDRYGEITVLAFKDAVEECKTNLFNDAIVEIQGKLSVEIEIDEDENGEIKEKRDVKIFLSKIRKVSTLDERKKVFVKIDTNNQRHMSLFRNVYNKYPGYDTIICYNPILKRQFKVNTTVNCNEDFLKELYTAAKLKKEEVVVQ